MTRPIVNIDELELADHGKGSRFAARRARIGGLIGMSRLGAQYHLVPPGRTAYPRHNHYNNEELLVILEGQGSYRAGDDTWPIRAGDVIAAPAGGPETAHQLLNTGGADLGYLVISTRNDPDVVEYPDSAKFGVMAGVPEGAGMLGARFRYIGRKDTAVDYWDGEDIGDDE